MYIETSQMYTLASLKSTQTGQPGPVRGTPRPPEVHLAQPEVQPDQCAVSQEIGYQLYATFGAFYIPMSVMIVIYYRIYMVSSRLADAEARSKPVAPACSRQSSRHVVSGQNTPSTRKHFLAVPGAAAVPAEENALGPGNPLRTR